MPRRRLFRRLGVLTLGAAGCAAVFICAAPARIEHTRIVLQGADPASGITVLMEALRPWWANQAIDIVALADGIQINRRVSPGGSDDPPAGAFMAARAVEALAAVPRAPPPAPTAPDRLTPELSAQRDGLQAARAEADRNAATLSTALSEVARDTASLQAMDALPPEDSANAPMRKMLADLELHRIDLAARYAPDFPGIAIADTEIAGLKALLAQAAQHRPPHPAAAPLATLRAEQIRLQADLDAESRLRDGLASRVTMLDSLIAKRLAAPLPSPAASAPPALHAAIVALTPTELPDQRPAMCGAIALATLCAAWMLGRRRTLPAAGLAGRIDAIEQLVQLPVLRCLDVDGGAIGGAGGFATAGEQVAALPTHR